MFSVPGIHCAACVNTIDAYLRTEQGVGRVEGDAKAKEIRVFHWPNAIDREKVRAMISQIGYEAE